MENNIEVGPKWIEVVEQEVSRGDGTWLLHFVPMNCRHCTNALCARACPAGAIGTDANGAVLVNKNRCIGCAECLHACPFGSPQFGRDGLMEKCTLCAHREPDEPTACEQLCPVGAISSAAPSEISLQRRKRYLIMASPVLKAEER
ncbi:MAG: 4Fe-4S binding protein [Nitrospirales bacterium]|nr:4Fe-4S binding protein [Nitrospirales bacterium]